MAIPITQKAKSPIKKYDIIEGEKQTLDYGGNNIAQMISKNIETDEQEKGGSENPAQLPGSGDTTKTPGINPDKSMFKVPDDIKNIKLDLPKMDFKL
jgi:hypothetical protein